MAATYTKLKDGTWGVRSTFMISPNQSITVVKKDGMCKAERVASVVWHGAGVWLGTLHTTHKAGAGNVAKYGPPSGACVQCGKPAWGVCKGCGGPLHKLCKPGVAWECLGCAEATATVAATVAAMATVG